MRKLLGAVLGATVLAATAACGGGADSPDIGSGKAGAVETATLQVGLVPVVNVAPLYLGVKQGFFKEAGLELKPRIAQTFAANVATVVNGENQIGFGATVPLVVAIGSNVPIGLVANSDVVGAPPDGDNSGLFAAKGTTITSISDLEGKTVAINALSNVHDVAIKSAMLKAGADPSKVKFLEVALPDMVAALQTKRVDAIAVGEPFVTAAKAAGFAQVLYTYKEGYAAGTPIGSYFASKQFASKNPNTIKAFQTALAKSVDYAKAHPDEARAVMKEYTQIPPATLEKVTLGTYDSAIDDGSIDALVKLMTQTGTIKNGVPANKIVLARP